MRWILIFDYVSHRILARGMQRPPQLTPSKNEVFFGIYRFTILILLLLNLMNIARAEVTTYRDMGGVTFIKPAQSAVQTPPQNGGQAGPLTNASTGASIGVSTSAATVSAGALGHGRVWDGNGIIQNLPGSGLSGLVAIPNGLGIVRSRALAQAEEAGWFQPMKPILQSASALHGVDYHLLKALIAAESAFNPTAVSPKGAVGLMQLMPATASRFGVQADANQTISQKLVDPAVNIPAGTRYLRKLLDMFPGRTDLALAAYNAGEGAVQKYGNQIPPYKETQNYVRTVLGFYEQLTAGLGAALSAQLPAGSAAGLSAVAGAAPSVQPLPVVATPIRVSSGTVINGVPPAAPALANRTSTATGADAVPVLGVYADKPPLTAATIAQWPEGTVLKGQGASQSASAPTAPTPVPAAAASASSPTSDSNAVVSTTQFATQVRTAAPFGPAKTVVSTTPLPQMLQSTPLGTKPVYGLSGNNRLRALEAQQNRPAPVSLPVQPAISAPVPVTAAAVQAPAAVSPPPSAAVTRIHQRQSADGQVQVLTGNARP